MTYNKPNDKSWTDMCIYFDEHIYDAPEDRNDGILYQYLYHIIYMLACTKHFFKGPNSWESYDDFAMYAATKIYNRYIEPERVNDPELRYKSVLNYVKSVLDFIKVDWQKETFNEIIGYKDDDGESFHKLQSSLVEAVQSSYCNNEELMLDVIQVFMNIGDIIKKIVDNNPLSSSPIMRRRLIMSVLLTLISQTTLPTNIIDKEGEIEYKYNLHKKGRVKDIVLWRLDSTYSNLVYVLTEEVKKECSSLVGAIRADYELPDEDVTSILLTAFGNVARDNNEEF